MDFFQQQTMIQRAIQYRHSKATVYPADRVLEFIPWTSTGGDRGARTILFKQVVFTFLILNSYSIIKPFHPYIPFFRSIQNNEWKSPLKLLSVLCQLICTSTGSFSIIVMATNSWYLVLYRQVMHLTNVLFYILQLFIPCLVLHSCQDLLKQ